MKITNKNGFEFLNFISIKEAEMYQFHPIAGSYAVIKHDEMYLLCFNTWRNQWEIPAGRREGNENPEECAIRELYEETGQQVKNMNFAGLLKVNNLTDNGIKFNPVYTQTINKLQPFLQNNETSEIILWDREKEIGYIDEVDKTLIKYIELQTKTEG